MPICNYRYQCVRQCSGGGDVAVTQSIWAVIGRVDKCKTHQKESAMKHLSGLTRSDLMLI